MKRILSVLLLLTATITVKAESGLTAIEAKWVEAALPVLDFAESQGLAVDISIQPIARPNDVPISMGVQDGRCKLVLSMRGNADAEAVLHDAPDAQHALLIEATVAHELAHCWRYTQGMWHTLPAGFTESATGDDEELAMKRREMSATRREEGFADLLALAWTLKKHPSEYATVHGWLTRIRDDQPVTGAHHDTRAWLRIARTAAAFPEAGTLFEQVQSVWERGLKTAD